VPGKFPRLADCDFFSEHADHGQAPEQMPRLADYPRPAPAGSMACAFPRTPDASEQIGFSPLGVSFRRIVLPKPNRHPERTRFQRGEIPRVSGCISGKAEKPSEEVIGISSKSFRT
jgi:hypothetical protein